MASHVHGIDVLCDSCPQFVTFQQIDGFPYMVILVVAWFGWNTALLEVSRSFAPLCGGAYKLLIMAKWSSSYKATRMVSDPQSKKELPMHDEST